MIIWSEPKPIPNPGYIGYTGASKNEPLFEKIFLSFLLYILFNVSPLRCWLEIFSPSNSDSFWLIVYPLCRWPCSHHNSLSLVVWCSLYRQYAILRSICFESTTNLCCNLETTYQSTKNRMAMDTSSSCYSLSFIYYQPTAHSTYPLARYLGTCWWQIIIPSIL